MHLVRCDAHHVITHHRVSDCRAVKVEAKDSPDAEWLYYDFVGTPASPASNSVLGNLYNRNTGKPLQQSQISRVLNGTPHNGSLVQSVGGYWFEYVLPVELKDELPTHPLDPGLFAQFAVEDEVWKPVVFKGNAYEAEISNLGRFKAPSGQLRTVLPTSDQEYAAVVLPGNVHAYVHQLVLTAFVGDCPEGHSGDHIECNQKFNNIWFAADSPHADACNLVRALHTHPYSRVALAIASDSVAPCDAALGNLP